jgi:hypothetical protein
MSRNEVGSEVHTVGDGTGGLGCSGAEKGSAKMMHVNAWGSGIESDRIPRPFDGAEHARRNQRITVRFPVD